MFSFLGLGNTINKQLSAEKAREIAGVKTEGNTSNNNF